MMLARRGSAASGVAPVWLTGVVYTQRNVYPTNTVATYAGMNNGSANGSLSSQTGLSPDSINFVRADCGSVQEVSHIVIGYDYLNNLPGGWGVAQTEGRYVLGSVDAVTWSLIGTTPTYASSGSANGLVTIPVNASYRYIIISHFDENLVSHMSGHMCLLEFQVWVRP